jgi:hypothetical protein
VTVAQDRTPAGCFWAVAIVWGGLTWFFPATGVIASEKQALSMLAVGILFVLAAAMTIERKRYSDSVLTIDATPAPGKTFDGVITTPLETAPEVRVKLELVWATRRYGRTIWQAEIGAPGMREVPFRFEIPAEVANEMRPGCRWTVSIRANVLPIPYRASFNMSPT